MCYINLRFTYLYTYILTTQLAGYCFSDPFAYMSVC